MVFEFKEIEPDNLVLQQLRAIRNDLTGPGTEVRAGFTAVEHRLGRLEATASELHANYAALSVRIDAVQADARILKTRYKTTG